MLNHGQKNLDLAKCHFIENVGHQPPGEVIDVRSLYQRSHSLCAIVKRLLLISHCFAGLLVPAFLAFFAFDKGQVTSRSFTTYCVSLELRSLPSTGVTRLPRYYEP